jgi:hypothetical protein
MKYKARWFQLHAIANYAVTYLTYNDTVLCLTNSTYSEQPVSNYIYLYIILLIHIYHCIAFNIRLDDWVHHISGVFITAPIFALYPNKAKSIACFFICGLPGAIDYTMLILYKNNAIQKITQKRVCAYLNTYIRMPGSIIAVYLIYTNSIILNSILLKILAGILYVNACFYGKQSIETYEKYKIIKL